MYYKVLWNNHSCVSSKMDWTKYLPVKNDDETWAPGKWLPKLRGELELCAKGYHLTDKEHLLDWCRGNQLFEAEIDGETIKGNDKVACRKMRLTRQVEGWNERTLRLFAVWCAREVLKLVDNPDQRSVAACDVAEKYANGDATQKELAAAGDAAGAAAWAAAWDAARDAARDAAWDAARDAARAAAGAAAWAAAWDAARDAAWDAAWDAQYKKLYDMVGI
jgi:hypothetical protein